MHKGIQGNKTKTQGGLSFNELSSNRCGYWEVSFLKKFVHIKYHLQEVNDIHQNPMLNIDFRTGEMNKYFPGFRCRVLAAMQKSWPMRSACLR
jgi:hypothetical protein